MDKLSEEIRKEGDKTQDDEYYVGPSALTLHNWAEKAAQLEHICDELLDALEDVVGEVEDWYHSEFQGCSFHNPEQFKEYHDLIHKTKELSVAARESSRE